MQLGRGNGVEDHGEKTRGCLKTAEQIRAAIIHGEFKPGERLIEKQLTDQLNISRHPLREALRLLSREGLVEIRVNRGAIVCRTQLGGLRESPEHSRSA